MDQNLKNYLDSIHTPWEMMFYNMVWTQIGEVQGLSILDFGSGFGVTANHYAKNNTVIAVDPNPDMILNRFTENEYEQITGSLNRLEEFEANSFDLILCHNVLEYVEDKEAYIKQFERLVKKDGRISIVKHNHAGRIMSKVIFENKMDEAIDLLNGGDICAYNFGKINYYDMEQIICSSNLKITKGMGIRTFWGLQQNNDAKYKDNWSDKMLQVELKVCEMEEFMKIAFFNHILLQPTNN